MRHIHVGDVGTVYRAPIQASDILGDPDTATAEMIFSLPNDVILTKTLGQGSPQDGWVTADSPTNPKTWTFTYIVQPDSGIGSPPDFHAAEGDVSVQVVLSWPSGFPAWHSDIFTGELDDLVLHIYPNLS